LLRDFEAAFPSAKVGRKRQLWFMNDVNFRVWGFLFDVWFPPLFSFLRLVWFVFFFFFYSVERWHCCPCPPVRWLLCVGRLAGMDSSALLAAFIFSSFFFSPGGVPPGFYLFICRHEDGPVRAHSPSRTSPQGGFFFFLSR